MGTWRAFPVLTLLAGLGILVGVAVLIVCWGKSEPFPFGPWLALGCILALVFSNPILDSYLLDLPAFL